MLNDAVLVRLVLALKKMDIQIQVDTDENDYQIGAALSQSHPDIQWNPIGFLSKILAVANQNYSVAEKEFVAVIWAVQNLWLCLYSE